MTNSNHAQAGPKERATHDKTMPDFTGNVIRSSVLNPEQVHYVQSFANELGRVSGLQGFPLCQYDVLHLPPINQ